MPSSFTSTVGAADPDLDTHLSAALDVVNAAATPGIDAAEELTVRITDGECALVAGISGWTWGVAAGIGMTWVRADVRAAGLGSRLLTDFEAEALRRGCAHVFVTSFTFQAPAFYTRHGYVEFARWQDVPRVGEADVHLKKILRGPGAPNKSPQLST
jgi:GNAT superfamily N-acetyltransferase